MSEKGDGEKVGGGGRGMSEWVMVVSLSGGDEQPFWMERGATRARMEEGYVYVCIYSRGDSHPCCAVLQDFLQLGFLGEAVCPSGLASV